jgi:cytochrome c553
MATVASNLSDDDIDALASYVEGLHHVAPGDATEPPAQNAAAQPAAAPGAPGTVQPNAEPAAEPVTVEATPTPSG